MVNNKTKKRLLLKRKSTKIKELNKNKNKNKKNTLKKIRRNKKESSSRRQKGGVGECISINGNGINKDVVISYVFYKDNDKCVEDNTNNVIVDNVDDVDGMNVLNVVVDKKEVLDGMEILRNARNHFEIEPFSKTNKKVNCEKVNCENVNCDKHRAYQELMKMAININPDVVYPSNIYEEELLKRGLKIMYEEIKIKLYNNNNNEEIRALITKYITYLYKYITEHMIDKEAFKEEIQFCKSLSK